MSLKVLLLVFLCYCPLIAQIKAECYIESPLVVSTRPTFFRNFKTATTLIPDGDGLIRLDNDESIIGYCPNYFVNLTEMRLQKITASCECGEVTVYTDYDSYSPNSLLYQCAPYVRIKTCDIQFSTDKAVRPKIFKKIGTRLLYIGPEMARIKIKDNQQVTAQCSTKFKSPLHPTPELNLICIDGRIIALGHPFDINYKNFECESRKWNVYESKTQFPWCPPSMVSYLFARTLAHNGYEYLAGLCYDFDRMSFKSLYYAAKPKFAENLTPSILESYELEMEIPDVDETFISKRTFVYENLKMQKWIISHYKTDSIVQYRRLHIDLFQQFDQLLNIDWWSGLKLGNWELYQDAFANHIVNDNNEYDILAGVSKEVAVPVGRKNITLVKVVDSENNRLPLYVWNYLKSVKNSSDDVVIIGVNTPFADFYNEKELLFCNDICHTIDWLQDVYKTFRYRPMGIIFCCAFNEVLASMRLDGFADPQTPIPSTNVRVEFD